MSIIIQYVRPRTVYAAGFSGSVTVPSDVQEVTLWVQGAGGCGRERADVEGSGGGGGAFVYFNSAVLSTEWGTSLTLSVGAGALNAAGGDSTGTGTLNGTAFTLTAGGGKRGGTAADGDGGTASGGTTNIDGQPGFGFVAAPLDERAPGFGGAAGGASQDLIEAGGAGSNGTLPGLLIAGEDGYIAIEWG